MSIEAMKQWLEALEFHSAGDEIDEKIITSLRQAIAEAEKQKPVAYGMWDTQLGRGSRMMMVRLDKGQDGCIVPLYTSPPQRQWVGLTDEEMLSVVHYTQLDNARAIEAKLKEKNT